MTFHGESVLQALQLDPGLLRRSAELYEGFGRSYEAQATNEPFGNSALLVASSYVIAASYWALLEPSRATLLFRAAMAAYGRTDHPFRIPLAICAGEKSYVEAYLQDRLFGTHERTGHPSESGNVVYDLLAAIGTVRPDSPEDGTHSIGRVLEISNATPFVQAGRLGLPLYLYRAMATAMVNVVTGATILSGVRSDQQ